MNDINNYITAISEKYSQVQTSEMGYRSNFENLLNDIFSDINKLHVLHDAKANQGNKPDFIILKDKIPLLYIEAKDIGVSLDKVEKSEQMSRYFGYANLILTDYVEFRFYRNGIAYGDPIKIAEFNRSSRTITPLPSNFEYLIKTILDFTQSHKEPIKTANHLAKIMGGKAQRIRENVRYFFDSGSSQQSELLSVFETIKRLLVQDLSIESFSDMYAQTLVYGLFVARYHDQSSESFSRQEARDLIPTRNPFLQHFFDHLAGPNFDKRLGYIVDELCEVFQHANVKALLEEYKNDSDPVIHFYEDFLREYDSDLRKKMGAYYTPVPVVNFIVRSVDEILKNDFGIKQGLASSETIDYEIETGQDLRSDRRLKKKTSFTIQIPKVQILDPAVGTATFLNQIIKYIYQQFQNQEGRWPSYVNDILLKQLFGFEIMMTPYTIAHLKLGMTLRETGIEDIKSRLGIFLTNSLEEGVEIPTDLFSFGLAQAVNEESRLASEIKTTRPVMVVIGNPPYSVSSSNKGEWITDLIKVYKSNLNERNINSLSDDYVKFIRFSEHFIEKNGSGIVAMITNNSFLDGITHRQMRKHLLETFDDIYVLDLHGNSKKKEKTPDGRKDENIFDIQQGVSINIFVRKNNNKTGLGKVFHTDLYGKRAEKFDVLNRSKIDSITWDQLESPEPDFFFVPKDFRLEEEYDEGFKIDELFLDYGSGVKFRKDNLLVKNHLSKQSVKELLQDMNTLSNSELYSKYGFNDTSDWKLKEKRWFFKNDDDKNIIPVQYRPFDIHYTYYPIETINQIIPRGDSRKTLMKNFLSKNVGLITKRGTSWNWNEVFITKMLMDLNYLSAQTYIFPLYIYSDGEKRSNIKMEIVNRLESVVGTIAPEDVFEYIYAILYSPIYREKYKDFLKINFPRIPYPKDSNSFSRLVELGRELCKLHLLESPNVNEFITSYPLRGTNIVEDLKYRDGNVYINSEQYFGDVPETAWNFYIGGYQPAQKWLKDRKGKKLRNEDTEHYQKMIVSLVETERIMQKIDSIVTEYEYFDS